MAPTSVNSSRSKGPSNLQFKQDNRPAIEEVRSTVLPGVLDRLYLIEYFPGKGGGGYSTKFHTGGYAPYPIIPYTICNGKGTPFLHLLFTNGTPFTYLV